MVEVGFLSSSMSTLLLPFPFGCSVFNLTQALPCNVENALVFTRFVVSSLWAGKSLPLPGDRASHLLPTTSCSLRTFYVKFHTNHQLKSESPFGKINWERMKTQKQFKMLLSILSMSNILRKMPRCSDRLVVQSWDMQQMWQAEDKQPLHFPRLLQLSQETGTYHFRIHFTWCLFTYIWSHKNGEGTVPEFNFIVTVWCSQTS